MSQKRIKVPIHLLGDLNVYIKLYTGSTMDLYINTFVMQIKEDAQKFLTSQLWIKKILAEVLDPQTSNKSSLAFFIQLICFQFHNWLSVQFEIVDTSLQIQLFLSAFLTLQISLQSQKGEFFLNLLFHYNWSYLILETKSSCFIK